MDAQNHMRQMFFNNTLTFLLQVKMEFVRPYQDFYLHNQLDKVLIILYIKDFFLKLRILWGGGEGEIDYHRGIMCTISLKTFFPSP